jgi:hypothetical protein
MSAPMAERRIRFAVAVAAVLLACACASDRLSGDERIEQRRMVRGWLIEDVNEMDGGLQVRMSRSGRDYRLAWSTSFWRGNRGPVRGGAFRWRDCASGGSGEMEDRAVPLTEGLLRERFAGYFAECAVPEATAREILRGFGPAFALASRWAERAQAATDAENEAIANYGREPGAPANNGEDEQPNR